MASRITRRPATPRSSAPGDGHGQGTRCRRYHAGARAARVRVRDGHWTGRPTRRRRHAQCRPWRRPVWRPWQEHDDPARRLVRAAGPAPGTYILEFREGPVRPAPGSSPQVSGAKLAVDGRDLSGIKVAPIHRVRATGRVITAPEARGLLSPAAIHVSAFPAIDGMPGDDGRADHKRRFLVLLRGLAWPQLRSSQRRRGWVVKAIRYKNADVMKTPIEFKERAGRLRNRDRPPAPEIPLQAEDLPPELKLETGNWKLEAGS